MGDKDKWQLVEQSDGRWKWVTTHVSSADRQREFAMLIQEAFAEQQLEDSGLEDAKDALQKFMLPKGK